MELVELSPTYIEIELPKNVPSKVRPIVIFPVAGLNEISLKVTQYNKRYDGTTFETVLSPDKPHIINLNTGVE